MRRVVFLVLALILVSDSADARRRVFYKIKKPTPPAIAKPVPAPATTPVRIIPIARWDLWCARIGGLDCAP